MNDPHKNEPVETDQPTENVSPGSNRPARRRWYRRPKTWLFILLGCFLFNLLLSIVPVFCSDKPASYVRNEEGQFISDSGAMTDLVTAPAISLYSQEMDSSHQNDDMGTTPYKPLLCRHVAIFNLSQDPLMRAVARSFTHELGRICPAIEQIDYYPAGQTIKPGSRLPDVYMYLNNTPIIKSSMLPGTDYDEQEREREGTWDKLVRYADLTPGRDSYDLTASLLYGSDPFGMATMPPDSMTPPTLNFLALGIGTQTYSAIGVGLPITDDNLQAQAMGTRLAKAAYLKPHLKGDGLEWSPKLPESLYPPFREADPAIQKIVDQFSFHPSVIGHSLMTYNDSAWVLKSEKDARKKLLAEAKALLEAAGWKVVPAYDNYLSKRLAPNKSNGTIFAKKGNHEVTVGPIPKVAFDVGMPIGEQDVYPGYRYPNNDGWIGIRYRNRMGNDDVVSAIKKFLVEGLKKSKGGVTENTIQIALIYEKYWSNVPDVATSVQEVLEQRFARLPRSLSLDTLLLLARLQYNADDKEVAFQTLRKAAVLFRLLSPLSKRDSEVVRNQAESWGQKAMINGRISRKELEELGFKEVQPDFQSYELVVKQKEPIRLFVVNKDNETEALIMRVTLGDWNLSQQRSEKSTRYRFEATRVGANVSIVQSKVAIDYSYSMNLINELTVQYNIEGRSSFVSDPIYLFQESEAFPAMSFKAEPTDDSDTIKVTITKQD